MMRTVLRSWPGIRFGRPAAGRYTPWKAGLLACLCLLGPAAFAQSFVSRQLPFPGEGGRVSQWVDFDGDGDLDVLFGRTWQGVTCYRNDGSVFTPLVMQSDVNFQPDFGDFNQDGRLDILGNGRMERDANPSQAVNIFPFDGCGYRTRTGDLFPGEFGLEQAVAGAWGDDDGDGDADVLFGLHSVPFQLILFRNQDGQYRRHTTLEVPGEFKYAAHLDWRDFDRDGDLDILLLTGLRVTIFRNQNGTYTPLDDPALNRFPVISVQWTDLDGDGNLDVVETGFLTGASGVGYNQPAGIEALLYRDGGYQSWFTDYGARQNQTTYLYGQPGDWDNDGRPDLVVSVRLEHTDEAFLRLYRNTGTGFAVARDIPLPAALAGMSPSVVDYDRDGDLDIMGGATMFENTGLAPNGAPTVPAGLAAAVSGNAVTLSWGAAADDHTAAAGLTYNVHVSTSVEGLYYLNGMSQLSTGGRNVPKPGNAGALRTKRLTGLPDGTYYWTVQALDPSYAASAYAAFGSFAIANGQPADAAIALALPQLLNSCECAQMAVGVRPTGTFGPGNRFLIQLSDATGSFARPTLLYNVLDSYTRDSPFNHGNLWEGGTALGWIPPTVQQGTRYRVRVVSTNPVRVSPDNGYDVAIKKLPQLAAIAGAPQTLCVDPPDTRLSLRTPSQYANHYEWELLPGEAGMLTVSGAEASIDWNEAFTGRAAVRVTGVNGCGRGPTSAAAGFTLGPPPGAMGPIRYPDPVCPGQREAVLEIAAVANAHTYAWTLPPGVSPAAGSRPDSTHIRVHIGPDFAQGLVRVVARAACGASVESTVLLSAAGPVAQAGPVAGPAVACRGSVVTYSAPPVPHAGQYEWVLPAGFVPVDGKTVTAGASITLKVTEEGRSGSIQLKGGNACGDGLLSPPYAVSVADKPAAPAPIQGPAQVCPGRRVTYRVDASPGVGYEWHLPEGMHPVGGGGPSWQLVAETDPQFSGGPLRVVAVNACGRSDAPTALSVTTYPAPAPVVITRTCNVLAIPPGGYPARWFLDGQPLGDEAAEQLSARVEGTYSVAVYAPCDTLETALFVKPFGVEARELPNVITPNGDQYNDTFQLPTQLLGSYLEIYNRWGQAVYRNASYRNDWDGAGAETGMYYYLLKTDCLPQPLKGIIHVRK